MTVREEIIDDIDLLLSIMPPRVRERLTDARDREALIEIVLDLGRLPEARFTDREITISEEEVSREDIDYVVERIGEFGGDNRAGIERTLHRISAIRNRRGEVVGLTCRVGRAVFGTIDIIRDLVEGGKSILLLGKPGVGKCVTADSLILTEHGLIPMADLIPDGIQDDEFLPIDLRVFGMNGLEEASHAYSGGLSTTLRVTTRQGFSLEGTREHPVLVMQENGELAFRPLRDLRPGDYVAIQRNQQCFGTETRLPTFDFIVRTNATDHAVPEHLTEELGRFLGYLVAEGTLSYEKSVSFSNTDPEVQAEMTQLTEQLFGLPLRKHLHEGQWNGKDFRIFGVKLRRFLAHLGMGIGLAADKRVPLCILTAPKPIVTAFLQALFEGDGSIYGDHGRIEIGSASKELLTTLHILLLNYGIVGNLRQKYNRKYDRHYHVLTLLGEDVQRFAAQIGFRSTYKRERLAEALERMESRSRNSNVDVIPYQNDHLRELGELTGDPARSYLARYTRADERAPSYSALERILVDAEASAAAAPTYQMLQALLETNFFFDSIKQVEEREEYVYDLSVPGSHSFFSNGLVSHNTTLLRETARVLAEKKRVVIVDTSNEIAGDGDIPHPAIGRSRRMQVPTPELQHEIMIEAVENHTPQVIVIDEIGREEEAAAARTIAERGVQLVGTAHGNQLDNLMMNPTLSDLVGGIASVTLSDEEARRRGTQKSVLERKAPPTFDVVIEIQDRDTLNVHHDVASAVDILLRGRALNAQVRHRTESGEIETREETVNVGEALQRASGQGQSQGESRTRRPGDRGNRRPQEEPMLRPGARMPEPGPPPVYEASVSYATPVTPTVASPPDARGGLRSMRLYPYGVSQNRLKQAARALNLPVTVVSDLGEADVLLTLRSYYRKRPQVIADAERRGTSVYVLRSNTVTQMESALADIFGVGGPPDPFEEALRETKEAIDQIRRGAPYVELSPRDAYIRRHQHELARSSDVMSRSKGKEPNRRVRLYPNNTLPY